MNEKPVDGKCTCNDRYELIDSYCVLKRGKCTNEVVGCLYCLAETSDKCATCNVEDNFKYQPTQLENGSFICECAYAGYKPNDNGACAPPTSSGCNVSIQGCISCESDVNACSICDTLKGYKLNDGKCECLYEFLEPNDQGVCDYPTTSGCNITINGCVKCNSDTPNVCAFCDVKKHFKSLATEGQCECDTGYELTTDGQCLIPIGQVEIDRLKEELNIPDEYVEISGTDFNLTIPDNDNIKDNKFAVFTGTVDDGIKKLNIEHNIYDNVRLNLKGNKLDVSPQDENAKCILAPQAADATLNFNNQSDGVSIESKATRKLTLGLQNSFDGVLKLKNLTTNDVITLVPQNNIEFDYINLFNKGNVENNDPDKNISANHVNVQQGATANLQGVEIKNDLSVAPSSTIKIGQKVKYEGKDIRILYSQAQKEGANIFEGILDQIPGSIRVSSTTTNTILEDETMTIAKESPSNFNNETCDEWARKVSGDFGDAKCEKSSSENKVVAKKIDSGGKKKNKLSGGAIAGIVIACVVVVAAIIALLVYFLVIKKKNQSTTSTQGDSSIAI
ncbi:hypothetical protein M9Y10_010238 [Tritrichomonas musculus]|uniref:Uncharacterized protein n=1 Tax=Tritrichomonas musculus TaxID=1915356 RepID=A0ABR2IQS9_9EUKA